MDNFKKLEHFFKTDLMIKKTLIHNAPYDFNSYTEDDLMRYSDNLYSEIKYMFSQIKIIIKNFSVNDKQLIKILDDKYNKCIEELGHSCNSLDKLKRFYNDYLTDMSDKIISETRDNISGYGWWNDIPSDMFEKAKTLNELLHVVHASIVNNDMIYQSINKLATKEVKCEPSSTMEYPVTLYGDDKGMLAKKLFDDIPDIFDVGWTDIVSLESTCNKIIMMVRDRGHALMIEMEIGDKDIKVEYHIPKVCNIDMVNSLPGIRKVEDDRCGANGMFIVDKKDFSSSIIDFINKVPTDEDMLISYKNKGHM